MITPPRRVVVRSSCLVAMLLGVGVEVRAQMPVPGGTGVTGMQSPAVFGGARRAGETDQVFAASLSVLGGYDTNILAADGTTGGVSGPIGSTDQTSSSFAGTSAGLTWQRSSPRTMYFGGLGAHYRGFFDIKDLDVTSFDAHAGLGVQLTRRSSLVLAGAVGAQPFYQSGALGAFGGIGIGQFQPGGGAAFTPDLQGAFEKVLRFNGQVGYSYRLSEKTTFSADAWRSAFRPLNDAAERAGFVSLGATSVGARLTRQLTRDLGARLGYGYLRNDTVALLPVAGTDSPSQQFDVHNIDVGLNYGKQFGFARNTTVSFGTGTNITRAASGSAVSGNSGTRFNLVGFASLRHQFLRTWSATALYTRGTSYLEGYRSFGVFDTVNLAISGLITDRVDAGAGVFYTNGDIATLSGGRTENLGAGAQVRYAFTQNLAMFASYTYSRFDAPPGLRPLLTTETYRPDRQGVRFGVTSWFDLLR